MRVLFLSRWYPFPADNGAKIRILNLLRQLGRRHEVSLVTFADATDRVDAETRAALLDVCRDLHVVAYRPFRPTSARSALGLLSPTPRSLVDTYRDDIAASIGALVNSREFDLTIASQLDMVPYALAARRGPLLLEELELAVYRDATRVPRRRVAALRSEFTWAKLASYVRRTLPRFAACTVVSEDERRIVAGVAPSYRPVHVVPNAVDAGSYRGFAGHVETHAAVFAGALTYGANFDGAAWFLREVAPALLTRVPEFRLQITGGTAGVDLARLPNRAAADLTGYVPDIRPVVARAGVSVVPLRKGGGTRLKILEAMAIGTPVVSTSKGAEGLDVTHGEDILIADDPRDFAAWVEAVLRDPALRARLVENGRQLVRSRYDWDVVGPEFCAIAERAAQARPTRGASVA